MILFGALVALELAALVLAELLHRRRPHPPHAHRALLVLLAFAALNEVATEALHAIFRGAPRPLGGVVRGLYHVETALVLGWPALLAVTAWRVFHELPGHRIAGRSLDAPPVIKRAVFLDLIAGAWLGLVAAMALLYPLDPPGSGAPRTKLLLHVGELAGVAAAAGAIVTAWTPPVRWSRPAVVVGLLWSVELAVALLGPWAHNVFTDWDKLARVPYVLGFTATGLLLRWWHSAARPRR